jgi:hypothetical protein
MPVPARITLALDAIGAEGPWVDEALGGTEPMVDDWEAGKSLPTQEQVERLAEMTGRPVEFFYLAPTGQEMKPTRFFICERGRRPQNALTVVESRIDERGVLHVDELTPPKPPYRPRTRTATRETTVPAPYRRRPADVVHVPHEDPDAPGCCITCRRPVDAATDRHVPDVSHLPAAPVDSRQLAAGERRPQ